MFYFAHFTTWQQRNKNNACILISSFLLVLESTSKAAVVDEKSLTDGRTTASTHLEHVTLNSGKLLNGSFSTFSNFAGGSMVMLKATSHIRGLRTCIILSLTQNHDMTDLH